MQANDEDKMIEFANYLRRLETKKKNFAKSVERKLDTQGKKFDYESRRKFNDAWFGAYKKAAALEQAKRKGDNMSQKYVKNQYSQAVSVYMESY